MTGVDKILKKHFEAKWQEIGTLTFYPEILDSNDDVLEEKNKNLDGQNNYYREENYDLRIWLGTSLS